MDVCRNMGSICRPHMYNVADMFVQRHMQVMWNECMPVVMAMFFTAYEVDILT